MTCYAELRIALWITQESNVRKVWVQAEHNGATGLWEVTLTEDLPAEQAAGAALEVFRGKVTLCEREQFEISAIDPRTRQRIHQPENYQNGSGCDGDVALIEVDGTSG